MISVTEARKLLNANYPVPRTETIKLSDASGRVLANAVFSQIAVPPFDNSAMDGYAFEFDTWKAQALDIVGESSAGKPWENKLETGKAMRIFTGAMLPVGADTVVMQEKTEIVNGQLKIADPGLFKGANVRLAGSQNIAGAELLKKDTYLSAGALGFLAGCGIVDIEVYSIPRVSILVTGDEIIPPGQKLLPGQVFECNSYSLLGALFPIGIKPRIAMIEDNPNSIEKSIELELKTCEILLLTGGVSVGDYDFVVPALEKQGVTRIFHRVKQKPAKPLYAGKFKDQLVLGLPGNPASVLTSFYIYVKPILDHLLGCVAAESTAIFASDFNRKPGLTQFLKGILENGEVHLTPGQESYRMDGFAHANCLVEIPEEVAVIKCGEKVKIIAF